MRICNWQNTERRGSIPSSEKVEVPERTYLYVNHAAKYTRQTAMERINQHKTKKSNELYVKLTDQRYCNMILTLREWYYLVKNTVVDNQMPSWGWPHQFSWAYLNNRCHSFHSWPLTSHFHHQT